MKICVVSQQIGKIFSGPGLYTFNVVNFLVNDGHDVSVISPEIQRPSGSLGFHFYGVANPVFQKTQARWLPLSILFGNELYRLFRKNHYDIVHFTDAREALFAPRITPTLGNMNDTYAAELQPLSYYRKYYSDWKARWIYYQNVHFFEKLALNRLDRVIANSKYTAKTIINNYQIPESKVDVCYKSVQIDEWRQKVGEAKKKNTNKHLRVLFVGTNMQRKGLPTLIQAAPKIVNLFPDVEFYIVGEDKVIPKMERLCKQLGVEKNFNFAGWRSQTELPEIYASSLVFVMPSLTEALGVVILEAQAAGLPVIATRVGGIPEIIQDGENGILVDPDSPEQLAGAIVRLLSDADLVESIINNAFLRLKPFSLKSMMNQTYQIYQSVINK